MASRDHTAIPTSNGSTMCSRSGLVVAPQALLKELGLDAHAADARPTAREVAALIVEPDERKPALPDPGPSSSSPRLGGAARRRQPGGPPLPDDLSRPPARARHDACARPGRSRSWRRRAAAGSFWCASRRRRRSRRARRARRLGGDAAPALRAAAARDRRACRAAAHATSELRLVYAPQGRDLAAGSPFRCAARDGRRPADARRPQAAARLASACSPMPTDRRLPALLEAEPRGAGRGLDRSSPSRCSARCTSCCAGSTPPSRTLIRELARRAARRISTRACSPSCCGSCSSSTPRTATSCPRAPTATRAAALRAELLACAGSTPSSLEDAALNPDTMDERRGGWGRLLALFRLVHSGHRSRLRSRRAAASCSIRTQFPFLEGRDDAGRCAARAAGLATAASCASSKA